MKIVVDEEGKKAVELLGDLALKFKGNEVYNFVQSVYKTMVLSSKIEMVEEKPKEK